MELRGTAEEMTDRQAVELLVLLLSYGSIDEVPSPALSSLTVRELVGDLVDSLPRADHSIGWTNQLRERVEALYGRDALT
jgi:hypothetical protein